MSGRSVDSAGTEYQWLKFIRPAAGLRLTPQVRCLIHTVGECRAVPDGARCVVSAGTAIMLAAIIVVDVFLSVPDRAVSAAIA